MDESKYVNTGKDALVNEIKKRRAGGRSISVDLRAADDKLIAALDTDDLENGEFSEKSEDQEKTKPNAPEALRNQLVNVPETPAKPTQPTDDEFAGGMIALNKVDGLLYQVTKTPADEYNKPVKARVPAQDNGHPGFYWEGSEAEFAEQFEKA